MVLLGEIISIFAGIPALIIVLTGLLVSYAILAGREKIRYWYIVLPFFVILSFARMEWASSESVICSDEKSLIEGKNNAEEKTVVEEKMNITGKVSKVVEKADYIQLYLKSPKVICGENMLESKGLVINYSGNEEIIYGDVIECQGCVKMYEKSGNPGNFNTWEYYETMNIEGYVNADDVQIVEKNDFFWNRWIFELKDRMKETYNRIAVGEDAGLYVSLVLGDKSMLDVNIKELYQANGMAHILAISGLHISIIGIGLYKLLRKCLVPFPVCFLINLVLIISYGIMTGNSVSAVRAITMFVMSILADVIGRTYDIASALSFSASVLLLIYPKMIYNSGFLLSFLAVAGIVVIKPAIDCCIYGGDPEKRREKIKKMNRFVRGLLDTLSASVSVNIAIMPVLLNSYYEIPLYSVIINIFVLPLMSLLMISTVSGGVIGMICLPAGAFFIGTAHYILVFYEWICKVFMQLPYSVVIVGKPSFGAIVFYYLTLAAVVFAVCRWGRVVAALVLIPILSVIIRFESDFCMRMLDVGQGDSIHICSEGVHMLVDGGSTSERNVGQYRIIPYLKSQGVSTLEFMVVTHGDSDHINGLLEIFEDGQIKVSNLILPQINPTTEGYERIREAAYVAGTNVLYINAGNVFECGKIRVKCLHPTANYRYESENDYSTVLLLTYEEFDILLTGDVEDRGENAMILSKVLSDVEVLKVAHHGSKNSTDMEFLDAVKPEIALISCDENNSYGHPHKELLKRLEDAECKVLTTPEYGAITIMEDNAKYIIKEYIRR